MYTIAETFMPGEFLKEEIDARGWSQIEFAEIIGRPARLISEIITGKRAITPETAIQISKALETTPELWMNLESQYQLSKVKQPDDLISRRAKLYSLFPVKAMEKRGWISSSKNIDILEQQFLDFFSISSIDEKPQFRLAAKKTQIYEELTIEQLAWLFRAKKIASEQVVKKYTKEKLQDAIVELKKLLVAPEEIRHVSKILFECGVRFVIVEALPGSKIDGACFWLSKSQPTIAMTLRLDRIDNYWFVLRHEIEHILQEHGNNEFILDQDIEFSSSSTAKEEAIANKAAIDFCVSNAEMSSFINRVSPYFSREKIKQFASRIGVHPGLVVGQLQRHRGRYDFLREFQVKVRKFSLESATSDGWKDKYM